MKDTPDSPPASLENALAEALDRAVGTSFDSLHVLREAVRKFARHQKSRGVPLDNVMLSVSSVLLEAEDDHVGSNNGDESRDPELARQLRAWCSEDYTAA